MCHQKTECESSSQGKEYPGWCWGRGNLDDAEKEYPLDGAEVEETVDDAEEEETLNGSEE
jgi:hypothetical protein